MDKHKAYVLTLGWSLFSIVVVGAAMGEMRLDLYVSLFTVVYFAVSSYFKPRTRFGDVVGAVLFTVFCIIVAIHVAEIFGFELI